jgi:hypothetical protein
LVAVFESRVIEFDVRCIGVFHEDTTVVLKNSLKFSGFDYSCVVDAVEQEFPNGLIKDIYFDGTESKVEEAHFLTVEHGTKLCAKMTFNFVFDPSKDHPGSFFDTTNAFKQRVLSFRSSYHTKGSR